MLLCSVPAVAGVYSVADKEVYRDDVTQPTVYQNFVLTSRPVRPLIPTTLTCSEFRTNFYYLKEQLPFLKERISKAQKVVIRYPKTYDMAIKALFGSKNVTYEPCPSSRGEVVIKICTGGKKWK